MAKADLKEEKKSVKAKNVAVKKTVSKRNEKKVAAPKTMRNRSGLHTLNPRKSSVKEATVSLKIAVIGVDGIAKGNMSLPVEVFGIVPNKNLIAQAIRVYLANQRQGTASTKTRSEVVGSTRKIYRQKGTGRARHGAVKAPIFVGGGIAFGPHPHDFSLKFPQKMRKAALISALSEKAQAGFIKIIDGEFSGKTKEAAKLMKSLELVKKGKAERVLFITDTNENTTRATHNLKGIELENAQTLSTYGVVVNKNVVFMKSAIEEVVKRLGKN